MLINTHWVYSTRRGSRISRIRSFWRIAMCLFQRSCVLVRGMNIQNNVDFFEEYRVKWSWQKSNKWGGNEPTWNSRYLNILRPHEPTSIPSQSITSSKLGSSTSVVTISVACHFGRPTSRFLDAESDTYAAVSWFIHVYPWNSCWGWKSDENPRWNQSWNRSWWGSSQLRRSPQKNCGFCATGMLVRETHILTLTPSLPKIFPFQILCYKLLNQSLTCIMLIIPCRLIGWLIGWSVDRLIDWSIDRWIDRLIDWLSDWWVYDLNNGIYKCPKTNKWSMNDKI